MRALMFVILGSCAFMTGIYWFAKHYPEYVHSKEEIAECAKAHRRQAVYQVREDDIGQSIAKLNDLAVEMCQDIGL
jgi:hypothetical protein